MNLCLELGCNACCTGMVHRKIAASEAAFLLDGQNYTYLDRADKFEAATQVTSRPLVGHNSYNDPVASFRDGRGSSDKKVNVVLPGRCVHLEPAPTGGHCGDYEKRPTSCRAMTPGSRECLSIRKEKGMV